MFFQVTALYAKPSSLNQVMYTFEKSLSKASAGLEV